MAKNISKNVLGSATRPQVGRMHAIVTRLQRGDYPSRKDLAKDLEVTTKTIQRDIDFMRDREGIPIEYDPYKYGYWLTEPVTNFPLLKLSEGEVVALLLAERALAQYHGTPLEQPLRLACQKLVESLKTEFSISWADLDAAISFRGIESNPVDPALFKELNFAVKACREVSFEYCKLESKRYESRCLRPFHLTCYEHQWYVIGYDKLRREERTFMLGRMRSLEVSTTSFTRPKSFNPERTLKGSFGIFSGGEPIEILVLFDAFAACLIRERLWHHSQRIRSLPAGEIEMKLTLTSTIEIIPWILRWGVHAKALAPKDLVETIAKTISGMADRYLNPVNRLPGVL
jgi:predicted DNA-binding transcriptional regulator YafY